MRELKKRRWIQEEIEEKEGKGRPRYIYKPAMSLNELLKKIEQEKLKEVESIKKDISELKHLIERR